MGNKVRFIKTNSKHMCSLCIDLVDVYLYLFCIYMPCDITTRENIDEYENVLAEISAICRNNDAMLFCIAGDFNTAFVREQSWHTQSLKQFMSQENLICEVDFIQSRVDYSYLPQH